ncbi:DUF732 domain-containing protein [Candidatus Mycobacterium methanotrophicum]|uniref:DUF732 domain-containing protein n=1 Tax=Candidatus Mycobacterium methanotrophicum TaxID=2943498 RepID=A0ABY4QHW9_9MYCO|nr:DUF732 domain-containing protein [Candidatus Mycobacterium methanotrophicum]UQX09414.1 DUF732 domain-containing protein [Candidatus Mycobacterium methanotrophicum]
MRILAAASGAAIATATSAHADATDNAFFAALDRAGIEYADPQEAIDAGKAVCAALEEGRPIPVVARGLNLANPDLTPVNAAQFLVIAEEAYCTVGVLGGSGG